mmetsp:Transcript_123855/g.174668  ORF Transcript_123855/g.174668 Transcript_123855/m.174668 type:complete len:124 (-) Transcript_123855:90-461(-)
MGNKMCCQCNDGAEENVTAVVARGYEVDPDETLDSKRTVVTIVFQKPDGSNKEINFTMRPWGIDFTKAVPVTVKRVRANSHAASLGVQTDWVALKIGERDMPEEFAEAMQIIQKNVLSLPERK